MFALENLWVVLGLGIFALLIAVLVFLRRKLKWGFSARVVAALALGIAFGVGLQVVFGAETASGVGAAIRKWVNVVGVVFIKGLQLIIAPLVLVSIARAVSKLSGSLEGIKKAGWVISFLLVTTAISAVVSIIVARLFKLSASHLIEYTASTRQPADVATTILDLVPANLFAALSGGSVLPVVFVAALHDSVAA
jgi:L-cystine uptake protein TcyP (sodium:dicarboxylate symporter family)